MQKVIPNPHMFQFYLDFGATEHGPWARVGFSNVEYVVGFDASKEVDHRPSQEDTVNTTGEGTVHSFPNA
jgi:hypothetical protein